MQSEWNFSGTEGWCRWNSVTAIHDWNKSVMLLCCHVITLMVIALGSVHESFHMQTHHFTFHHLESCTNFLFIEWKLHRKTQPTLIYLQPCVTHIHLHHMGRSLLHMSRDDFTCTRITRLVLPSWNWSHWRLFTFDENELDLRNAVDLLHSKQSDLPKYWLMGTSLRGYKCFSLEVGPEVGPWIQHCAQKNV